MSALPLHLRSIEDVSSREELARATQIIAQRFAAVDLQRLKQLAPDTRVIEFQDVVFRSAWPFEGANGFRDDALLARPNCPIRHVDGALAQLRIIEPDKRKRIRRYAALDFKLAGSVGRVAEAQNRFLLGIDDRPEFALGKYILQNYRELQLFYDSTHPASPIFEHLSLYVWNALAMPGAQPKTPAIDHWKIRSLPVHPLIARRLGHRWADEKTRYQYGNLGDLTWQQWVEAYVETLG